MKKNILLYIFASGFIFTAFGQQQVKHQQNLTGSNQEWCVADEITNSYIRENSSEKAHQDFLKAVKKQAENIKQQKSGSRAVRVIPVVVHVVHNPSNPNTPTENVPNSDIYELLDILNEDFRRLNADAANTRPAFVGVAADAEIEFCLASRDPGGASTDGITRTTTSKVYFDPDTETNDMKSGSSGGIDPWDPYSYINIWVCNISDYKGYGTAGYAYLPTPGMHGSNIDGIVLDFDIGIGNGSRTGTHEVGHYMGLVHTWGSNPPSCSADDGYADTPNCGQQNFGCDFSANSCGTPDGDQIENFMDYSNCPNMFSTDQANYMNAILSGTRSSLLNSLGCEPTAPPVADFSGNPLTVQAGGFVDFTDLTTGNPDAWSWTFNGGNPGTSTDKNPAGIQYNTIGLYDVSLTASNILGSDSETKTDYIEVVAPTGCDTLNFPPPGTLVRYITAEGHIVGHNEYGDLAKAQYFPATQYSPNTHITGGLFYFAKAYKASGSSAQVAFHVYADDGAGGTPGTVLGTVTRDLADIVTNVQNNNYTRVLFNPPVDLSTVTNGFYLGFEMINFVATSNSPADTLGLVSNTDDDGTGLNAWEQWSDNSWNDFATSWGGSVDVDLFISPFMTNLPPTPDFTSDLSEVCAGGSITFNSANSINAEEYYWDANGDGTYDFYTTDTIITITYSAAGTYDVNLLAVGPCTGIHDTTITSMITIHPNPELSTSTNSTTCGNCDGDATVNVASGTSPFSYQWDAGANNQTTATATALCAGTYQVLVSDVNNCTAVTAATVNDPAGMTVSITTTDEYCGNANGTAAAAATNGTSPYDYLWSNNETTSTITGLSSGTYHVTITDANGCTVATDFYSAAVISNAIFSITVTNTPTDETCSGPCDGTITSSASGGTSPYTYDWSSGDTGDVVTGLCPGTYDVTVTDDNGCSEISTGITINATSSLSVSSSSVDASCFGLCDGEGTASPSGTSPYSYQWDTGAGSQTTQTAVGLCAGSYDVTVSDGSGCSAIATVTINEPTAVVTSVTVTDVSCFGICDGSLSASASGGTPGYTYSWSNGATSGIITGLCAGTYSITATDANGCTGTAMATVNEPAQMALTTSSTDANCGSADGDACVDNVTGGTSPYSYLWSNGSTAACSGPVAAGNHTVTVTDSNGCTVTATETVNNTGAPTTSISSFSDVSCNGLCDGEATVAVSGGTTPYDYQWTNGATVATATGLCAGVHSVTLTDANSCISISSVTISEPDLLVASVAKTDISCNGACDGIADATETGGIGPFTYAWSNTGTGSTQTGLCPGTYTVTITDVNTCTATASTVITEPTALGITMSSTNVSCNGACDGTAGAGVTGGTPSHSYLWSNGSIASNLSNLCADVYTVTITDANACTITGSVTVTEPGPLSVSVTCDSASVAGLADGSATATISGGATPFSYLWSNAATTATITGLVPDTYSVTITDGNNCTATDACTVYQPACAVSVTVSTTASTCFDSNGEVSANATGGLSPYSYSWSNGANTQTVTGISAGTYVVTVTDASGCTTTGSGLVSNSGGISNPVATASSIDTCAGSSIVLSTNSGSYTYLWNNGVTSRSFIDQPTASTTYTVTITEDGTGCTATASVSVTVSPNPIASITPGSATACHLEPVVFEAGGGSTYIWNETDTINNGVISPSFYTVYPDTIGFNNYTVEVMVGGCDTAINFTVNMDGAYAYITADTTTLYLSQGATVNLFSTPYSWGTVDFWDFDDGNTSAAIDPGHTFLNTGVYHVRLKMDFNNCSSYDTLPITVLQDVGLPGYSSLKNSLQIYPNPTSDQLFLRFSLAKEEDIEIRLMNSIGKLVMVEKGNLVKDARLIIDMSDYANGAYFLSVRTETEVVTKKIMLIE